jgi:hypothetical protein
VGGGGGAGGLVLGGGGGGGGVVGPTVLEIPLGLEVRFFLLLYVKLKMRPQSLTSGL